MVAALFLELAERISAATIPNIVYRTSKKMACPCASKPNCYPHDYELAPTSKYLKACFHH